MLTIFNRPDTTARVMEAIRIARPSQLLIVADGARGNVDGDPEKCAAAREIAANVDWNCRVLTNFSAVNLGLRKRMQTGLDWVFEQVTEAIILEDDCLPHPTFFRFCSELLERYRNEPSIFTIGGTNFQPVGRRIEYSYYFSAYPFVWGWATWRRSWQLYDGDMREWPALRGTQWHDVLQDRDAARYWNYLFEKTFEGFNTWDYQLTFTSWRHRSLNIMPSVNLISNLGFGPDATHTVNGSGPRYAELPVEPIKFPLSHPPVISRDETQDEFTEKFLYSGNLTRLFRDVHARKGARS